MIQYWNWQWPDNEKILVLTGLCLLLLTAYASLLPPHKRGLLSGQWAKWSMPPGPRNSTFIVGDLPEWLKARNSGQIVAWLVKQARHGEFTTLRMGSKTWVLLNSARVVHEIIAKRAGITHERPHFPIAGTLVSRDKRLFLQKTRDWRQGRKVLHQLMFGAANTDSHNRVLHEASVRLLNAYIKKPLEWHHHNYRFPLEIMYKLVTNTSLRQSNAELEDLQRVTSTFLTCLNSSFVEFFPQVTYLPRFLQFWRRRWQTLGEFHYGIFRRWWASMKPLMEASAPNSFLRDSILRAYPDDEEQAMFVTMFALSAGADNPRMTMNAWLMACLAYPSVMERSRAELDRVCGGTEKKPLRLPSLDDLESMPYMCAVVKEVLRWRPTVPLVPQRVLVQDLEFEGYRFPAGTEFLINSVAVCSNGYVRAGEFYPERWLADNANQSSEAGHGRGVEQDLWEYAFSGGRRSCVGYKLAQKELFLSFSRLLFCFDISPRGEFDDTQLNAFVPGEPFPVKIAPRSPAHERLIHQETSAL